MDQRPVPDRHAQTRKGDDKKRHKKRGRGSIFKDPRPFSDLLLQHRPTGPLTEKLPESTRPIVAQLVRREKAFDIRDWPFSDAN